jgi:hypothetical protein
MKTFKPNLRAFKVFVLATTLAVFSNQLLPATTLTGVNVFSVNSSGATADGTEWNTLGGDTIVNLFLIAGTNYSAGSFINGPNDAQAAVNIPLSAGIYTYIVMPGQTGNNVYFGMNLFFNGNNATPKISTFGIIQNNVNPPYPGFAADGSASTFTLDGSTVAGANSLSYQDGNTLITLSDYRMAPASIYNVDRITANVFNAGSVGSDGNPDAVGEFTLTVTTVPEPQSITLIALAGSALMMFRRKKA